MSADCQYWAVVPAAGVARRMGGEVPKQYLTLLGRAVIEHTLARLLDHPLINGVVVALSETDEWWPDTAFAEHPRVGRVTGGAERCHSVLNALIHLADSASADDWVLVHDAARPCIRQRDLERLINTLSGHPVGGLLGVPVSDTMKHSNAAAEVLETLPRERLWHAQTPQMFRLSALRDALSDALDKDRLVTDEASAMELAGHRPMMVEGSADNIKITRPEDLALAAFLMERQG